MPKITVDLADIFENGWRIQQPNWRKTSLCCRASLVSLAYSIPPVAVPNVWWKNIRLSYETDSPKDSTKSNSLKANATIQERNYSYASWNYQCIYFRWPNFANTILDENTCPAAANFKSCHQHCEPTAQSLSNDSTTLGFSSPWVKPVRKNTMWQNTWDWKQTRCQTSLNPKDHTTKLDRIRKENNTLDFETCFEYE